MNWIVLVLLSAVLFAASNIIRKFVLTKEHTLEFLAARGFFVIAILILLTPWVNTSIDLRILGLIYVSSLVATAGYYYQTKAQRHTDISYLSPLQNLSPIILLILAFLFFHETISIVQFVGLLSMVLGSYMLAMEPGSNFLSPLRDFHNKYAIAIWVSIVLLAVAAALDKFMISLVDPMTYLFFGWLFMNINYLVLNYWLYDWTHLTVDFVKGWHWLLIAAICTVASTFLYYKAISIEGVLITLVLPLRRVSTLIETIFGGTLFHENHLPQRVFACLIMLLGVALIVR